MFIYVIIRYTKKQGVIKMRIQRKKRPRLGERRVITKFLIWPRTINNETRFLEKAYIVQVFGLGGWIDKEWRDF